MLTIQQRIKVVELFFAEKSIVRTQRAFCRLYSVRTAPTKRTILRLIDKFRCEGSVGDKPRSGRPNSARTPEVIDKVRDSVLISPKTSSRRRSQQLDVTHTTLRRVLKDDLKLLPYKIQVKQSLNVVDRQSRLHMCEWLNETIEHNPHWIANVWFSDEAHFHLNGVVNRQNFRYWGSEKPHEVAERPLHSPKCTAWCAMSTHGIIGPLWFEDEDGDAVTVNAERYRKILVKFWSALRRKRSVSIADQWFQQDGATAHTATATLDWLKSKFGQNIISRSTAHPWASHSPDLNPPDFFLWGYVKDRVYVNKPRTIAQLKDAVSDVVRGISPDVCRNVVDNFTVRVRECSARNGAHVEHVL
jgi:Helix-turn-helix domain (DUF4817)